MDLEADNALVAHASDVEWGIKSMSICELYRSSGLSVVYPDMLAGPIPMSAAVSIPSDDAITLLLSANRDSG